MVTETLRYNIGVRTALQCVVSIELSIHLSICTITIAMNNLVELLLWLVIATAGAPRRALRDCLADGLYPIVNHIVLSVV